LWPYGQTDGTPEFQSTRSSPGDDLKIMASIKTAGKKPSLYCNIVDILFTIGIHYTQTERKIMTQKHKKRERHRKKQTGLRLRLTKQIIGHFGDGFLRVK